MLNQINQVQIPFDWWKSSSTLCCQRAWLSVGVYGSTDFIWVGTSIAAEAEMLSEQSCPDHQVPFKTSLFWKRDINKWMWNASVPGTSKTWRWICVHVCTADYTHSSRREYMNPLLGMWNGEMVSLSSDSLGLSSGTFPFSISTFPSITCVSTPLAAWTNFWRFQKRETKWRCRYAEALLL